MGKYTAEEKQQLLDNLGIETAHRIRMLQTRLADEVSAYIARHERQITALPKLVRALTMKEFADNYNGDPQAALVGLQKARMGYDAPPLDRTAMKRKWVQDAEDKGEGPSKIAHGHDINPARSVKNARMAPPSPLKKPAFGGGGARNPPPPSKIPPSPRKRVLSGAPPPPSPNKPKSRMPSAANFAPNLPKTPGFPRWPRKHENMLSINGSPLTNPYELGLDWLAHDSPDGPRASTSSLDEDGRPKSRIVIRAEGSGHSRSNSQASNLSGAGGRANSRQGNEAAAAGLFSARVAVPTKDGHMLEFDPLHTSPAALDKLSGITDSAKKQAKEDMARLLQQAVRKWNIDS